MSGQTAIACFAEMPLAEDQAALPAAGRRLLQRHRTLVAPAAVLVVSTINEHLGDPSAAAGADIRYPAWPNHARVTKVARAGGGRRDPGRPVGQQATG